VDEAGEKSGKRECHRFTLRRGARHDNVDASPRDCGEYHRRHGRHALQVIGESTRAPVELTAAPEHLGKAVQVVERRHAATTRDLAARRREDSMLCSWLAPRDNNEVVNLTVPV
jgi:hypothetical protein